MGKVISVVSQKGGVGKTTTAANLAAAFAREGQNVLLLETDPQGALAHCLGFDPYALKYGLTDVLLGEIAAREAIVSTPVEGLWLLPALGRATADELELEACASAHPLHLREIIDAVNARFDTVLMDAPPTLGSITRMTLAATDSFLVPVQAEEFAFRTLDRLFLTVGDIRRDFNPDLACEGLLVTMADLRTRMSVRVINQLHEQHGDKVLMSMVPRTVSLQDMPVRGKPTVLYAASSRGGLAYSEVAQEILGNLAHPVPQSEELNGGNGGHPNGADEIDRLLAQIRPGGNNEDELRIL